MPVYNAQNTLPAAMTSVLKSQDGNIEIILVDDGSDDQSGAIADSYADRDPRVRVLHTSHQGLIAALNAGLEAVTGEWMLRMDADDVAHPGRIDHYRKAMADYPDVDVWGSLIRYFPSQGLKDGLLLYEQWVNSLVSHEDIVRDLFVECPIPHPALACRRAEVIDAGGYLDNGFPEDYDLIFRLCERGKTFGKIDKTLLFWRDHPERLSRTESRYHLSRFRTLKVSVLKRTLLKDRDAVVSAAGPVGKAFARELMKQDVTVQAFVEVDPQKIGNKVYGIPVLPVERVKEIHGPLILHAVGQKGGREQGRELYKSCGLIEGKDFVCVS